MTTQTRSTFLRGLSSEAQRDAIAGLDPERVKAIVRRALPGRPTGAATIADALAETDAAFEVVTRPLSVHLPNGDLMKHPEKVATLAVSATREPAFLGTVSPAYGIVQNREAFAALDVMLERGLIQLTGVQTVDAGRIVRVSGLLGTTSIEGLRLGGADVLAHVAVFETSHDGSKPTGAWLDTLRLVCLNGMTTRETIRRVAIRHTSNAVDRVAAASAQLLELEEAAVKEAQLLAELAATPMVETEFRSFAEVLLNDVRGVLADEAKEAARARRADEIEELTALFSYGRGNAGVSLYDGFNSVTEWIDAKEAKRNDALALAKRFESSRFGAGAALKARAVQLLVRR
jgi:hypothetical protein